ncbi:ribbon-helix-helix protein, CopG family [Jiangella rhizosphaerae]|uniref:Ribbon-helix-helix protein, CopG family n=1 Tax=Jiangella rhizosphaerae TaxID=2293569 RepID=A0A418KVD8_9ACTN|nr:ribbon-helix-helix protein, CopG family [Jiangella rhizosphaerae]RIQ34753.1 ribbon-helix-helix protein, CopG family [Jiangella rhizosphaerae]
MRTTVRLDEDLMRQVKEYAARKNQTITSVLEDGLRQLLERDRRDVDGPRADLIVFTGDGLHVGIDLDDRSTWAELAEAEDAEHFQGVDRVDA